MKSTNTGSTEQPKSRFDRFRNADVMGVRRYIEDGEHILLVKRAQQGASRNTEKLKQDASLEKTVIEFKVIETKLLDGREWIVDEAGRTTRKAMGPLAEFEPLRVNEACSLTEVSSSSGYDGNVLAVTAGILGMGIDEMNADENFAEIFESVYGPHQIFAGMLVRCIAQQVPTTSANAKSKVYTAKTWEAIPVEDYEQYGLTAPDGAYDPNNTRAAAPAVEGEGLADEGSDGEDGVSAEA